MLKIALARVQACPYMWGPKFDFGYKVHDFSFSQ